MALNQASVPHPVPQGNIKWKLKMKVRLTEWKLEGRVELLMKKQKKKKENSYY